MIKKLLSIPLIFLCLSSFAQKIKVKKNEIFIDDVLSAHFEKTESFRKNGAYIIKSLNDSIILSATLKTEYSLLEQKDLGFSYLTINFPSLNKIIGINTDEIDYYTYENYFVKYFINKGVIKNGQLDIEAAKNLIAANPDPVPSSITSYLDKEQEIISKMGKITDRDKTKEISLSQSKSDIVNELGVNYQRNNYKIFQDRVLIGYAAYFIKPSNGSKIEGKLVFYDADNTPIGRLQISDFGNIRIYPLNAMINFIDHKFNSTIYPNPEAKLIDVAKFFISKNAL